MRTVPSRRENINKCTVPCRRKKKYRPFPSWKKLHTVPSRRDKLHAPSRPVMEKKVIVMYRTVPSRELTPTVLSRPIQDFFYLISFPSRPVPSRLRFFSRETCQNSTIPSRLEYHQP